MNRLAFTTLLITFGLSPQANADNWQPLAGADKLLELVSGATAEHEASSGNKWTFPLGIGASKTSIIGDRPWKFGLQFWHYVKSPDNFGPDYQIRFSVSPVVKLPW